VRVLAASDALAVTMLGHIHAQDALLGPLLYLHATFLGPAPGHVEDAVLALEPVAHYLRRGCSPVMPAPAQRAHEGTFV